MASSNLGVAVKPLEVLGRRMLQEFRGPDQLLQTSQPYGAVIESNFSHAKWCAVPRFAVFALRM